MIDPLANDDSYSNEFEAESIITHPASDESHSSMQLSVLTMKNHESIIPRLTKAAILRAKAIRLKCSMTNQSNNTTRSAISYKPYSGKIPYARA